MTGVGRSEEGPRLLSGDSAGTGDTAGWDEPSQEMAPGDKGRPRLISIRKTDRDAVGPAANVTDALAQYLLSTERRILHQAEKVRASMLDDLERQRASIESLCALFADRLRQQEEGLASLRTELEVAIEQLNRQADVIHSPNEAQGRDAALWCQVLDLVRQLADIIESPPPAPDPGWPIKKK